MRVLGVIPARGGSKRVPRKNLRLLCGKPLIWWTIDAALKSDLTDFVVSTEDYEIGRVAADMGAYVIRRPDELAQDDTTTGAVLVHALEYMGDFDAVVCLHPTSPIRDPEHINKAIDLLPLGLPVTSVREIRQKTHYTVKQMVNGKLLSMPGTYYVLNASIYAMEREQLLKSRSHTADVSSAIIMDEAHSVDIDTEDDFSVAEAYLELKHGPAHV